MLLRFANLRGAILLGTLAGGLLASPAALAACRADGLLVFPTPGSVIPTNSRFILEGAGKEKSRLERLTTSEDLVLKASDDVVMVKVGKTKGVDYWVSDMNRVAVLLTPSKPLLPHREYTLLIERVLPGYEVLNETSMERLSWHTGGGGKDPKDPRDPKVTGIDKTAPRYQVKPAVAEGFYRKEGQGLTRYLRLNATLAEEAPAYFVVSLKRARGASNEQRYPVPISGGEANVGHDPCHGSFSFEDGRAYKMSIETFDSAGNKAAEVVRLEAQAPRPGLQ